MKIRTLATAAVLTLGFAGAALADSAPVLDPKCPKPEYPRSSLVNEEQGVVSLALVISESGNVVESKVIKSTGFRNLDRAAEAAFGKCKFKPGTKNGKPEQSSLKLDFAWTLG